MRGVGGSDEVVDELDLVVLPVPGEARAGLLDGDLLAAEGLGRLDVRAHALFDAREVLLGHGRPRGELEVVVEAVGDRRADRDLHALVQLHHRGRKNVRGVMPDQLEGALAAVAREDLHARPVRQLSREIEHLSPRPRDRVRDLHRERRAREPRPDRPRGVETGGAVGELERLPVGECHLDGHSAPQAIHQHSCSGASRAPGADAGATSSSGPSG